MLLSGFEEENFANYYKPSMTIGFPSCDFKCGRWCQNYALKDSKRVCIDDTKLVDRYLSNPLTSAIVCAGLDPMDSFDMLLHLVETFRRQTNDDIVIYTGYNEEEVTDETACLSRFKNIIVKYGRYVPDDEGTFDDVLGVRLASQNQYAVKIS